MELVGFIICAKHLTNGIFADVCKVTSFIDTLLSFLLNLLVIYTDSCYVVDHFFFQVVQDLLASLLSSFVCLE